MDRQLLIPFVIGPLLSSCTTSLETRPVPLSTTRVDGLEYSLPALELEFSITRRMVDCTPAADDGSTPLIPKFEVTVEPKQELVAAETFSMDYAKLSKAWKTSKLTVEWYDNRMLKSVNVSATDKSVDIALEVLKSGISIAKLAGGIPAAGGMAGADIAACPAEVGTRKQLLAQRKSAQSNLADQTAIIEAFNARAAAKLSKGEKKALGAAVTAAKEKTDAIADFDKKLAALDKVLAFTESVRWRPPSLAKAPSAQLHTFDFRIQSAPQTFEEQARVKWIKRLFSITDVDDIGIGDPGCENSLGADGEPKHFRCRLQLALALQLRLDPESIGAYADQITVTETALGLSPRKSKTERGRADHVAGIVTRMPARTRLLACSGAALPCERSSPTKLVDQLISVPQFGHYLVLPFSNGIGEDNALTASFAESGMPTSVTYEEKQAAGLAIAKGASQGADAILSFSDEVRAARKAREEDEKGAPLKALEDQVKLLEQQQKIAQYQAALDPANADLAAQKTRLDTQLAIITTRKQIAQLEIEITQLEVKTAADPADYAARAELERLKTKASVLEAQAAIAEQCTKNPSLPACAS